MAKRKGEKCARCGEYGEDRRTLWMACFYSMEELKIPFETKILFDTDTKQLKPAKEAIGIDIGGGRRLNLQAGTVTTSAELHPRQFYTMRVCKECRADWMQWIQTWFFLGNKQKRRTGTGAFRRYHGATVEMTNEEIAEFMKKHGHEPARVTAPCREHSCLRCEEYPCNRLKTEPTQTKPTREEAKKCKTCKKPCTPANRT